MLKMLGSIHQINGNYEVDDKKSMRIIKTHRRTIFVLIFLVLVLDISGFFTGENSFWSGLFSGVVGVMCVRGLFFNFKLSKNINTRIKKNMN